jgi:3D (Asp-Asp-Asp) domain-containing protein
MISQKGRRRTKKRTFSYSLPGILFTACAVFIPVFFLTTYTFAQEETKKTHITSNHLTLIEDGAPKVNTSFPPKLIKVRHGIENTKTIVYGETVKDALLDLGYSDFDKYLIRPSLDTTLTSRTNIVIKDFKEEIRTEYEEIPYSSRTILDDTREIDTTAIIQEGRTGRKELTVKYTYIDGMLDSREIIDEEIELESKDQITALGTKRVYREITINGDTFEYWKKMRVYATSYDSNCEGCNNYTATGAYLKKGVIAVDPKVIPMYTNMYVPGYGFGQALDVGGAVKGKHIDLGFNDLREVQGQWSARYVDIYILD